MNKQIKQDVLEICKLLLLLRGLEKEKSTYYDSMKELVNNKTGCINGQFNHCSTDTMRLSSKNPNMQNIPRKDTAKVKQYFVTRY